MSGWGSTRCLGLLLTLLPATGHSAPPDCLDDTGQWQIECLREQYQGPAAAWPAPAIDPGVAWQEWGPTPGLSAPQTWLAAGPTRARLAADLGKPALIELGQQLFFDARLSRGATTSCASCHQPAKAFGDGRALAIGEDGLMGRRRSMPLFAAPFTGQLFWDGRAADLGHQVLAPIADTREMNHPVAQAVARLAALPDYQTAFAQAFGEPGVTEARLARSLAAYVASIRPPRTRFDAFIAGESTAYRDQELIGLHVFRTKARCMNCHHGPLLTDHRFHNIGLSFLGRRNQDLGRYEITRDAADAGAFRTPSLRQTAQAGPWMHNGLFPRLDGLLRMYNAGMPPDSAPDNGGLRAPKSALIQPLSLSEPELRALEAFLRTL